MIAVIQGELRGTTKVKAKSGKEFYQHNVEMKRNDGGVYNIRVMSSSNTHQKGPVTLEVNIGFRKDREGKRMASFQIWEVDKTVAKK